MEDWEWISADRTADSCTGEADVRGREPRTPCTNDGWRTALAAADGGLSGSARGIRRKRRRRHVRRRRVVAVTLLAPAPVLCSYVSAMIQPSSLPLGIRTAEWIRGHQGAWLVNDLEGLYYGWNAPVWRIPGHLQAPLSLLRRCCASMPANDECAGVSRAVSLLCHARSTGGVG